jgi:hypothetical protein
MIAWPSLFAAASLTFVLLGSGTAHANQRADELSAEAGDLLFLSPPDYDGAIEKYQQAIVLSPEGRFYFNLCAAYYESGRYGLALQACDAVAVVGADEKVMKKTATVLGLVEKQLRNMGLDPDVLRRQIKEAEEGDDDPVDPVDPTDPDPDDPVDPVDPTDPNNGKGGKGGDGKGGGPGGGQVDLTQYNAEKPKDSLFATKPLSHDYTWTVGASLMAASSTVGGDYFGSGAGGFKGWVDYMVVPERKIGLQGHIGFTNVAPSDELDGGSLSIVEIGGSVYSHLRCMGRTCITPMVGVQLAGMQPSDIESTEVRLASFGIHAEANISFAFGKSWQHVLSVSPGFSVYMPAFGSYDNGLEAMDFGLDAAGAVIGVSFGYTRRFDTPFGQAPFITLE